MTKIKICPKIYVSCFKNVISDENHQILLKSGLKIKPNIAAAYDIQIVLRIYLKQQRHVVCLQIGISFGGNVPSGANKKGDMEDMDIIDKFRKPWNVIFNIHDQLYISLERPTKIYHTLPTLKLQVLTVFHIYASGSF